MEPDLTGGTPFDPASGAPSFGGDRRLARQWAEETKRLNERTRALQDATEAQKAYNRAAAATPGAAAQHFGGWGGFHANGGAGATAVNNGGHAPGAGRLFVPGGAGGPGAGRGFGPAAPAAPPVNGAAGGGGAAGGVPVVPPNGPGANLPIAPVQPPQQPAQNGNAGGGNNPWRAAGVVAAASVATAGAFLGRRAPGIQSRDLWANRAAMSSFNSLTNGSNIYDPAWKESVRTQVLNNVGWASLNGYTNGYRGALNTQDAMAGFEGLRHMGTGNVFDPRFSQAHRNMQMVANLNPGLGFEGAQAAQMQFFSPQVANQLLGTHGINIRPGGNPLPMDQAFRKITRRMEQVRGTPVTLKSLDAMNTPGTPASHWASQEFFGGAGPGTELFETYRKFTEADLRFQQRHGRGIDLKNRKDIELSGLDDNLVSRILEKESSTQARLNTQERGLIPAMENELGLRTELNQVIKEGLDEFEGFNRALGAATVGLGVFGPAISGAISLLGAVGGAYYGAGGGRAGLPGGGGGGGGGGAGWLGRGGKAMRGARTAGRFLGRGGWMSIAGTGLDLVTDWDRNPWGEALTTGAQWAGIGATVGSFVPGVGTLVGGAVGGVAGALYGGLRTHQGNQGDPHDDHAQTDPRLSKALAAMQRDNPNIRVNSAHRSHAEQESLRGAGATSQRGGAQNARHQRGLAADLDGDLAWAHANAHRYGLEFPDPSEPWHAEVQGTRTDVSKHRLREAGGAGMGSAGYRVGTPGPLPDHLRDSETISGIIAWGAQVGAKPTNAYREGSSTNHGLGRAVDYGQSKNPDLRAVYDHFRKVKHKLRELFLTPGGNRGDVPEWVAGGVVKKPYRGAIWDAHKDHVHVASWHRDLGAGSVDLSEWGLGPSGTGAPASETTGTAGGTGADSPGGRAGASAGGGSLGYAFGDRYGSANELDVILALTGDGGATTGVGAGLYDGEPGTTDSRSGAAGGSDPTASGEVNGDELEQFLKGLRQVESGNNYKEPDDRPRDKNGKVISSASGAYQYLKGTWAGYGGFRAAFLAPPSVQDERARKDIGGAFAKYGSWRAAAVSHIAPAWASDPKKWDRPLPGSNGGHTANSYATKVLQTAGMQGDPDDVSALYLPPRAGVGQAPSSEVSSVVPVPVGVPGPSYGRAPSGGGGGGGRTIHIQQLTMQVTLANGGRQEVDRMFDIISERSDSERRLDQAGQF